MPAAASTVNMTLTNYAQGYAQDNASALADFIAPRVPVGIASGQYKQFSDKNAFQVYKTARGVGGARQRIEFAAADKYFNCRPNGLEIAIDDHERELAGEGDQLGLEEAKTSTLVSNSITSHEVAVFESIKAAKAATAGAGVWSDVDVDPIEEIDAEILAISIRTGMMPNRMVIGIGAWSILKNHPLVKERIGGIGVTFTMEHLKACLLNPAIEIRVGLMTQDSTKFGKAKNAKNIVGAEVFTFIGSDSPTAYDPSFAKTFETKSGGVDVVKMYREEKSSSDIVAVDWSEDIQVVSTIGASRLTLT